MLRAGGSWNDPDLGSQAKQSLEELCQSYWPALYGYLRHRGHPSNDAEDLIQGFFTSLIQRQSIAAADQSRGRFRAFLYASLDHYVSNVRRRENTLKRGGGQNHLSIDRKRLEEIDEQLSGVSIADDTIDPAKVFDRQWALCLVAETLKELESEYEAKGKQTLFKELSPLLSAENHDPQERNAIAEKLNLSATALKVAIHRLRSNYRDRLIRAVAETLDDPNEWGREREYLLDAMKKD